MRLRPRPLLFALLLFWAACFVACPGRPIAQGLRPIPELPSGVSVLPQPPALNSVPVDLLIHAVAVDWTDPLLLARLESGLGDGGLTPPTRWESHVSVASMALPPRLYIQLAAPVEIPPDTAENPSDYPRWKLSPPAEPPPPFHHVVPSDPVTLNPALPIAAPFPATDQIRIGGIAPVGYLSADEAPAHAPDSLGLYASSGRADLLWLGSVADFLAAPPVLPFRDPLLATSLDPATGLGHFFLVENRSNRTASTATLAPWLAEALPLGATFALHATGEQIRIGVNDWYLGGLGRSVAARTGAVLFLTERRPGDTVDFARLDNVSLKPSSYEPVHPPRTAVSGRLWPAPLDPPLWSSRLQDAPDADPATFELNLGRDRPVSQLRLIYASAAGFSPHFNPAELEVTGTSGATLRPAFTQTLTPEGPLSILEFYPPQPLQTIRLTFTRPTTFNLPQPARLTAIQALGPME